ncbi:MAG: nucleoside hydrolase [Anaerolineae bacterium]|nr:nucleoside hydrolase [Anaerolineae bacterium]
MSTDNEKPGWFLYPIWIVLSFLCISIAFFLNLLVLNIITQVVGDFIYVNGVPHITQDYLFTYTLFPMVGLATGTLQYAFLRRYLPRMGWWVLATTGGWLIGMLLFLIPDWPNQTNRFLNFGLIFFVIGLAIGIAQWLLLRRRLFQAGWWIAANVVGWGLLALITVGDAPVSNPTVADTCTSVSPTSTLSTISIPIETVDPTSETQKMLLLYDDDGSRDGMAALLYLLSYPDISIQAITISYGEAHPQLYIQHMGCVLDTFGISDIPLGAGQDMPLAGGTPFPDWLRQLSDNFWGYPLPNTDKSYPFENAPNLMVSIINQAPEPVTIFVSGPFTNLAQALRLDPAIKSNISAVYFMGGAVYVPGNITNLDRDSNNQVADWNIIADPQAAKEAFESGLELYMVPLDATNKVLFSQEDIFPWRRGDDKANMVVDLTDIMFNTWGLKLAEIFDLTAAVLMVQSESCNFQPLHLEVITDNGPTLGQTIVVPNTESNIHVCLEPNVDQIKQNLNETFSP